LQNQSGKGKREVEEKWSRKIVLVNVHKSEEGILKKENDPTIQ
jgi:hypothetical protein